MNAIRIYVLCRSALMLAFCGFMLGSSPHGVEYVAPAAMFCGAVITLLAAIDWND